MGNKNAIDQDILTLIQQMQDYEMELMPSQAVLKEKYTLSDTFYKRMERLIENQSKAGKRVKQWRTVAASVAVVLLMGFAFHFNTVVEAAHSFIVWMERAVMMQFDGETSTETSEVRLTYYPEGFKLKHEEFFTENHCGSQKLTNGNKEIDFTYMVGNSALSINSEYADYQKMVDKKGNIVYVMKADGEGYAASIVWQNKEQTITYSIVGEISLDELWKMYEGVTAQ